MIFARIGQWRTVLLSAAVIILSLGIDYFSKNWAEQNFLVESSAFDFYRYDGKQLPFLTFGAEASQESFFSLNFNYVRNFGAAWGMFSNLSENIRVPFLAIVTVFSMFFLCTFYRSMPLQDRLGRFAILLIISGALGNFLNRIIRGYVIDWIDARWRIFNWTYSFPNFNWADICITGGVLLLLLSRLFTAKSSPSEPIT